MTTQPLCLDYHQIDAFTSDVFAGNPAAVYVLERWLNDATLAAIAAEHNLSETAFVVPGTVRHELRWFTPACEVELCGHATLASAHALLHCLDGFTTPLRFMTRRAGELVVDQADGVLWMDFPARQAEPLTTDVNALNAALGATAAEWRVSANNLAVFDNADQVAALAPDMRALAQQALRDNRGVIATAPADDGEHDFISRYFAPGHGVDEDPVTGSAHCTLAPYWAQRLGKDRLMGRQISARGGTVMCEMAGDRVRLGGHAVCFASGRSWIPSTGDSA